MAYSASLLFYDIIRLPIWVRIPKLKRFFAVSQIGEDATLGMPFVTAPTCSLDFARPVPLVDGRELVCTK